MPVSCMSGFHNSVVRLAALLKRTYLLGAKMPDRRRLRMAARRQNDRELFIVQRGLQGSSCQK
jgi:hypothetical protein